MTRFGPCRWIEGRASVRLQDPGVNLPDRRAVCAYFVHETGGVGKSATNGNAAKRGWLVGQDCLALKTPAAQNALDSQELAVVLDQRFGLRRGQRALVACAGKGAQRVRFVPAAGQ